MASRAGASGGCWPSPDPTDSIRKVHDFLTVGAAAPLQQAGALALALPPDYYAQLSASYQTKRDLMLSVLQGAGLRALKPDGAYYIMVDISDFDYESDVAFMSALIEKVGVAGVPGSSFFADPVLGSNSVRFCLCKKEQTIREAQARLAGAAKVLARVPTRAL